MVFFYNIDKKPRFTTRFKTSEFTDLELEKVDELEAKRNYDEFLKRRVELQGF